MIEAKIVADSITIHDNRLTTFVLTYPRFIHSEVMTHRMLSRNAASSRAIPVEKMIKRILEEPAKPVYWGKIQSGMQASHEVEDVAKVQAEAVWNAAMYEAVARAKELLKIGIHKQIANRLLEPFAHMTTIVTATDWGNFFNLRAHPDAQPEFQALAYKVLEAYIDSAPKLLSAHDWHLPFGDKYMDENLSKVQMRMIATARCARVSYLNFEGDIDHQKDYDLHNSLLTSGHCSPFEHCARPMTESEYESSKYSGNFKGFIQYRKTLQNENRFEFDAAKLLASKPSFTK